MQVSLSVDLANPRLKYRAYIRAGARRPAVSGMVGQPIAMYLRSTDKGLCDGRVVFARFFSVFSPCL